MYVDISPHYFKNLFLECFHKLLSFHGHQNLGTLFGTYFGCARAFWKLGPGVRYGENFQTADFSTRYQLWRHLPTSFSNVSGSLHSSDSKAWLYFSPQVLAKMSWQETENWQNVNFTKYRLICRYFMGGPRWWEAHLWFFKNCYVLKFHKISTSMTSKIRDQYLTPRANVLPKCFNCQSAGA